MKTISLLFSAFISLFMVSSSWADQNITINSQDPQSPLDTSIAPSAFQSSNGLIGINESTGILNLQANQRSISVAPTGASDAGNDATQALGSYDITTSPMNSQTYIGSHAFSNSSGIISINQAAGLANMQANQAAVSLGFPGLSVADNVLANSVSPSSVTTTDGSGTIGNSGVGIDSTAFDGTNGLVQLNQAAGISNTTANQFSLGIQP